MFKCPICQSEDHKRVMEVKNYPILKCAKCTLVFTGVEPEFDSSSIYTETFWHSKKRETGYEDYFKRKESTLKKCKSRLKKISDFIGKYHGKLLDIGCGPGFFLQAASDKGWEAFGIDVSEYAVDYAKRELGLKHVICDSKIPEKWSSHTFDVITLWAVIEHLPDPLSIMKSLTPRLKNDGILCLSTGNWNSIAARYKKENWRLMTPPGHLFFFTKKTIGQLLEKAGLQIIKYRTNDEFGAGRASLLRKNPMKKILRTLGLGDIMTLYARKY